MWDGYLTAIAEFIEAHPEIKSKVVIDRFHVAKNYRDGFDTLRKKECRRLRKSMSEESCQEIVKGMHWILRHNYANLTEDEKVRLRALFKHSPQLHEAYSLREELTAILNMHLTVQEGRSRLEKWAKKVKKSTVRTFDKFLKTLRNHIQMIANYFHNRASSGFVEGLNNKLKIVTRRSFGLSRKESLFSRLWLDTSGYKYFIS
jgi:transposase